MGKVINKIKSLLLVKNKQMSNKPANGESSTRLWWLFFTMRILPILGVGMVFFCALNFVDRYNPLNSLLPFAATVGYALLIGGAAYVVGGFGGFLFGLPRYLSNPDSPLKNFSRNDNLIQISDWLTKIIVGLGLTNLHKIPAMVGQLGDHLSAVLGGGKAAAVDAECVVIYFLVCGFLMGYLWTNTQYIPILTEVDEETRNMTAKKQAQETAANDAIDPLTDSINASDPTVYDKVEKIQKDILQNKNILSFAEFSNLLDRARQKLQKGLQAQSSVPDNLKDPNKNQWGGKAENNNRKVTAAVASMTNGELFRVVLTVISTGSEKPMNNGDVVIFALHSSFPDPFKVVTVKDGKASLEFISYGAFTVGVLCDNGQTELEYDLASLSNAPEKFIRN